jgi:hypothetical protein
MNGQGANPDAISMADVERYVADYTAPGAMRAGLELFRAFEKDSVGAASRPAIFAARECTTGLSRHAFR